MPNALPIPSPIVSNIRHGTHLSVPIPIGGYAPCMVSFARRLERADGTVEIVPDGDVQLTPQEFGTLPAFAAFYEQLRDLAHAKRATHDPT